MAVYARVLIDENYRDTVEVRGSRVKKHLYENLPCEYLCRGSFQEDVIDDSLGKIKPSEVYIDLYTLSKLSYGFYKKYHKVIREEFYEPDESK